MRGKFLAIVALAIALTDVGAEAACRGRVFRRPIFGRRPVARALANWRAARSARVERRAACSPHSTMCFGPACVAAPTVGSGGAVPADVPPALPAQPTGSGPGVLQPASGPAEVPPPTGSLPEASPAEPPGAIGSRSA